ncbi:MAG: beta-N-acetylhexosaminidase [Candidatus Gribaldobacteria bacterium]|nr:beta-N-acetylhexosaminidase [Candidatus Gribaldobacteria bacterium]
MKKSLAIIILAVIICGGGGILLYKNKLAVVYKPAIINAEINKASQTNLTDEELKKEIGQMIMIGFRGTAAPTSSDISKIIKDVAIGGVILSDYDFTSNTFPRNIVDPQQTKKIISDIQKYSAIPLLVAVDAEGGNVNRLAEKYGFLPIVSAKKMGQDKTLQTVYKESTDLATELKSLGFNMNLAPVIDVNINPKSPAIGALDRSFSSDPQEVINQARVFIQNHLKKNIITVEKHFPGHGSATKDSHQGLTDVTNTYKAEELLPYQKLNEEGLLKAVMVAHVINKKIDKNYPASLSTYFLQDILRKQIGFNGVIISDDMQMAAISDNYQLDEAVITAINAGVDVLIFLNNSPKGYDNEIAYKVRNIIFNAVKTNKIKEERIIESYNRILDLKKEFASPEIRAKNFELIGEPNTLTFGEALDIAKWVGKSVDIRPAFLLSIFQEELKLEKFDMCYLTNFSTGEGVRINDGKKLAKVMKPSRDIKNFLSITKDLKRDPLKTPVTCPMSFGWGGAMGPADFIPSTWMLYKDKIEKITGKPADPWNIQDAFLAAGLYLSESGAKTKTRKGEWNAAMIYFSGSTSSPYTWYADGAITIADEIQTEIDELEKIATP